jgi:hypothetical protein
MLAMAFGYANQAADAQNQYGTRPPRSAIAQLVCGSDPSDLPYDQTDILDALAGKLTARPAFA